MVLRPELILHVLLDALAQLGVLACVLYACVGFTLARNPLDMLLGTALVAWLIVVVAVSGSIHTPPQTLLELFAISAALALLLRQHARRRWNTLDWHITYDLSALTRARGSRG